MRGIISITLLFRSRAEFLHSVEMSSALRMAGLARCRKRTIVWSIQLRQSDGTDNKSGSNAARSELWRAVRGSAAERGHHLHAHRVTALSLVDIVEFYADDAFVCDPEPHRSGFEVQRWSV